MDKNIPYNPMEIPVAGKGHLWTSSEAELRLYELLNKQSPSLQDPFQQEKERLDERINSGRRTRTTEHTIKVSPPAPLGSTNFLPNSGK